MRDEPPKDFQLIQSDPFYTSNNSKLYLGIFKNTKAVLKLYPQEFPSEMVKRSYERDHNISSLLFEKYPENFCEPLDFHTETNKLYEIKTYEGTSLFNQLKGGGKQMKTETFLKIAIDICQGLQCIHEQNIIHCDLKPHNILKNEKDKCIIIDFESSFLVSLKNSKVSNAQKGFFFNFFIKLKGTYLYMSPEQTGRTNSLVDKTSDIYSLGITFYQLLTGKTPFEGDVTQVIYSHIAKEPPKMKYFVPDIPDALEEVVLKMIQKNQKDRYCSIVGVKKELEFIQKNLKNLKDFKAGQFDIHDIFGFEDILYGRDDQVELLTKNLKNAQENNFVGMSMISGSSGIGKSVIS
jgi:serine/threonine protein kinase